ncbi:MAG: hypothetical protein H0U57_11275 [Tatlockia sp.]|nr:hypothetical protein [Tatlockia sp.]
MSDHIGKALAKWGYLEYPEEVFTQKIQYWYDLKKGDPRCIYNGVDLYVMNELPDNPEVYNRCQIFLKEKNELYEVKASTVVPLEHGLKKMSHDVRPDNYYFTPIEYMQSIFGADAKSPIGKDPCYIDWLIAKAESITAKWPNLQQIPLNEEKAVAIVAISKLNAIDHLWIQALINDDEKGAKLRKIINKTEEICSFLIDTCDYSSRALIEEHSLVYKQEIYKMSYEFLNGKNTSQDKQQFAKNLHCSELCFRKKALSLDSDLLSSALKIITNFITHLTGIGILINGINKYLTGNWLLFSHSRNENIVRDNRIEILNDYNIQ